MPTGRPTDYTPELCEIIFRRVALGENINVICQDELMPCQDTIYEWRKKYPEFTENYYNATRDRADARQDRVDGYARDVAAGKLEPAAAAVILKAEIWQAGRENPKRYGDKQAVEHSGEVGWKQLVNGSMPAK